MTKRHLTGQIRITEMTNELVKIGVSRDRAEWVAINAEAVAEGRAAFVLPREKHEAA